MSKNSIAVFGAGGFGREVKFLIDQINDKVSTYEFIGYFDDSIPQGTVINGYPVLGGLEDLNAYPDTLCIALGVGDPNTKEMIVNGISNTKLSFPNLIHPAVIYDDETIEFGQGNIICAGTILTVNITMKDFVTLNLSCTVGHDTIIAAYVSCMRGVNISGEVHVHKSAYLGTGVKVINDVSIGSNTIVGAGAMVAKSLPENCTAVGVPAKPIKFHESAKK